MIGKTILHYKIIEQVGEGGMGVVYKAEDTKLKRDVAIKFLPRQISANEEERERFKIEAQAAAALNHSNIATIYAIEEANDEMFIVMEYIEGQELKEIIKSEIPNLQSVINYATQIAEGLQAAHEKGIIHRDIKSSNIMITPKGQVKIMDFGLAQVAGIGMEFSKEYTTLGTAAYMSPEQAQGEFVDARTDIWSFGVVLYEMLTGRLPFTGDYEQQIIYSILNDDPEPTVRLTPEIVQILQKTLAKNPNQRFQSIGEMVNALQTIESKNSVKTKIIKKSAKLAYWIAATVLVLFIIVFYLFKPFSKAVAVQDKVKTIAVLPFTDLSPQGDQGYFSDGLSEELINVLSKNPKLRVTARTSSFSFRGDNLDIKTIAAKLSVKNILEGSVQKEGNNLRISADLVNVETDATLWSNSYDGTLKDIFGLQDSISHSVAEALNATLLGKDNTAQEQKTVPEAYNAYLIGNHFSNLRDKEDLLKAVGYYENALSIDSAYAPAWVGLSQTHSRLADNGYMPLDEGYKKARMEVEKALKLDPNLAVAYSQMGWIKQYFDWDWEGADESYQKALDLESGNADVLSGAATLAFTLGRFKKAIRLIHRSIKLDPLRIAGYNNLGLFYWYADSTDKSEADFKKALELNPRYPSGHMMLGRIYLFEGKSDSALTEMMKEIDPDWRMYGLALVYYAAGKEKEADGILKEFINKYQNVDAFQIAEICAYGGNKDKAFDWLRRAYDQRDGGLAQIEGDPMFGNIQKDPRYLEFMKKLKLPS
jgi:serine/threonine protein kinase/tetratricopeptide (TPR) repeat protein